MLKKIILGSVIVSSVFASHQFEINLSDEDVEAGLKFDLSRSNNIEGDTYLGLKVLNGDTKNSNLIVDPDPLMEASFLIMRPVSNVSGLRVGLGVKALWAEIENDKYISVPLGVEVEWRLPVSPSIPLYLGGALYYAPGPLCFSDADRYLEQRAHFDIEVIRNGRITLGYRDVNTDIKTRDIVYNETAYAGFKFLF